ncbi:MAG: Gfo/Idh/MocA family oxidoreductase [Verrucomicrobia bacterium]|nr:Gfo/Idh/MocA family oxidoreductase [Verrucomicrobiota bacterium]
MNKTFSRREFLRRAAWTAAGLCAAPYVTTGLRAASPNETLLHASFGASGMARSDIEGITRGRAKLVAVADVDLAKARALKKEFPEIRIYQDWRELLDKEKTIDSVNVTVPDHMHAPMAMAAMQLGKHVYCQKPLTHDVYEARQLTEFARRRKLVTQMGIQIHSSGIYREAVRIIQDGTIGKVKEVHTWSNKAWGDPSPLPNRTDPVPADLDWDGWLGTAAARPFIGDGYYHPGIWRKRLDFGTGTFGDMGCHIYDPVFKALELTAPISLRSDGPAPNQWNWAINARIEYVFPGTAFTAEKTVKVIWYDGEERPPKDVQALLVDEKLPGQGSIFIGTKGVMMLPHIARAQLFPEKDFESWQRPKVTENDHWQQFVEACRGNGQTAAGFDYSGPLTETILLGSLATRFPKATLQWNAKSLKFTNLSDANQYVRRSYRKGWEVKGL